MPLTMATSNSKKPLSLPLIAFITTYLFLMLLHRVHSVETISFVFDKFDESNQNDLILQGDASISSSNALQLTRVDNSGNPLGGSVGRALYSTPIRLWDSSTGGVASIFTSFIFLISSPSTNTPPADGLTFFLASPDTTIPPNSGGGFLGLFSASNALNNSRKELVGFKASSDKVVAVEFDTYPNLNLGDPNYKHVGIDVNSIRSEVTAEWDWQNGQPVAVTITYDPYSKRLRVFASYPNGSRVDFTHDIDLTTVLPEWVRVGFSGSTGQYSQVNNIISWSFGSILGKNYVVGEGGLASVV